MWPSSAYRRTRGCSKVTRHRSPWLQSSGSRAPSSETAVTRRTDDPTEAWCAPSGCEVPLVYRFSCRRGRLHVRRHMGQDVLNRGTFFGSLRRSGVAVTQNAIYLRDDLGSIGCCHNTQKIVLL